MTIVDQSVVDSTRVLIIRDNIKDPADFKDIQAGDIWEYVNKPDWGDRIYRATTAAKYDPELGTYLCEVEFYN